MASEKNAPSGPPMDKAAKPAVVQQHPELLMAARKGHWTPLNVLLSNSGAGATPPAVPPGGLINIIIDDEEADVVDKSAGTITLDLELNNVLHVVASSGDGDEFLESARGIYCKAMHLLDERNKKGDTPFHCAARAGMLKMVTQLICLAKAEGGGDRVKAALRKQNEQGETALHAALRLSDKEAVLAMVHELRVADPELARFPLASGTSPLYLAVSLGREDIAERLHEQDPGLSYSGPNGQNVLHVAVLRSTSMTKNLLKWNNQLSKQGEQTNGSTPLHFAASCGFPETAKCLLEAEESLAYQCDNKGSFPIHEAVKEKQVRVVCTLLKICPDSAQLRDAKGKTFLHVAAKQGYAKLFPPVLQVLLQEKQMFASIMNMQDDDGNTGLHLAVEAGILETVCLLLWDKEVMLNLSNNKRKTALDLSQRMLTPGVIFGLGRRVTIHKLLVHADARYGVHSKTRIPELNEKKEEKRISDSTQTIGVVSALLVTISFAVAFTIPGGYRTDDDPKVDNIKGGMPVLVTSHSLQAFIIANNLALLCSAMATISLMYAGVTTVDISMRMKAFVMSIFFLNSSARTLAAAFALGMYATLVPAAGAAVTLTVVGATITLLDVAWFTYMTSKDQLVLRKRMGVGVALKWFALLVLRGVLACLWPYVIIAGFLAYITLWSK